MAEWLYIRAAQECFFINSQQYALRAVWAKREGGGLSSRIAPF